MPALNLQLSSQLQPDDLAQVYKKCGRIHIPDILTGNSAQALAEQVQAFNGWNLVFNSGDRHVDIYPEQLELMTDAQINEAHALACKGAENGFQYLFKNYPIYDAYHSGVCFQPFDSLFDFLNSEATLALIREVTGHQDIAYADAQLTKFERGHFLTTHDDNVDGKDRRAAYVLNLTPNWKAYWGGLLQFFGEDGHIEGGFTPSFNALNIFSIPKPHAVSQVTSFAGSSRYSVTGWFRAGVDPRA